MPKREIIARGGRRKPGRERGRWRNRAPGGEREAAIRNVFLFVGADPATSWLAGCGVEGDKNGFVITGARRAGNLPANENALESSVPGVFARGDVRFGSVERVGGAIGEGPQVGPALHHYLAPL